MGAQAYVIAYIVLSVVYAVVCIAYLGALRRTTQLAKKLGVDTGDVSAGDLDDADVREATQTAVRSVLGVDSAAFASAVLPVAYVAVTGLFGGLVSRNTAAAATLNPLWLLVTVALVLGSALFLSRIIAYDNALQSARGAVLSSSFASRHTSMFTYYEVFILVVTLFNVANTIYLLATLKSAIAMPYVGV